MLNTLIARVLVPFPLVRLGLLPAIIGWHVWSSNTNVTVSHKLFFMFYLWILYIIIINIICENPQICIDVPILHIHTFCLPPLWELAWWGTGDGGRGGAAYGREPAPRERGRVSHRGLQEVLNNTLHGLPVCPANITLPRPIISTLGIV